jgi:hypothetical protein
MFRSFACSLLDNNRDVAVECLPTWTRVNEGDSRPIVLRTELYMLYVWETRGEPVTKLVLNLS